MKIDDIAGVMGGLCPEKMVEADFEEGGAGGIGGDVPADTG